MYPVHLGFGSGLVEGERGFEVYTCCFSFDYD